ncbi:hypothetical protein J1N35_014657 [Gossypium stocksii]|uniref:Uncharacterized protein n=1 Tax=Gossypium stocksii TaxID=47602 RepID=A0A9D3VWI9_9ROSI|nr:hypothetical protein J1N35_014657 [Gossypium stocksii]
MSKGDSSHKVVARVSVKNVHVASTPKFKRYQVSAIQEFQPGCERVTVSNLGLTRQISVDRPSDDARDYLVLYVIRCVTVYTVLIDVRLKSRRSDLLGSYGCLTMDPPKA